MSLHRSSVPPLSAALAALATITAIIEWAARPAHAETVDATVTTLLAGHATPRDGAIYTVVPVYEMLSLLASDLRIPYIDDLRIELSAWGMVAFGSPGDSVNNCVGASASLGDHACVTGDLDLGFLEGKVWKRRITARLGRQLVTGGAARVTQFDGLDIDVRIARGLGVQVYGGAPVTPRFADSRGDALAGGRIYYRHSVSTELGVSAIYVLGQGRTARGDIAVDARYRALPQLTFTGYALYSLRELRLAEATIAATVTPTPMLEITGEYRRVAPDLFLSRNSIFSVFSQETRDEAGLWLSLLPRRGVRIYGDYHIVIDAGGMGHRGAAKATFALGPQTTIGVEGRVLRLPDNGYLDGRIFGTQRLGRAFTLTVDLDAVRLERALNGRDYSLTAAATAGWDFAPGWRSVVTAIGNVGPFVDGRFEVIAKLVYNHTYRFHQAVAKP